jgi:hypothetical protein
VDYTILQKRPLVPKGAAVQRPEEGETPGGSVLGRKAAVAWADFGKFERKSRWAAKATEPKLVWAAMRNRKGFQILIQRNEIQI